MNENVLFEFVFVMIKNHFRITRLSNMIVFEKFYPEFAIESKKCRIFIDSTNQMSIRIGNSDMSRVILRKTDISIESARKCLNENFDMLSWVD